MPGGSIDPTSALGEGSPAQSATAGELCDTGADGVLVNIGRVEGAAVPAPELVVLLVVQGGDGVKEPLKAGDAADILGRCAASTLKVAGIVLSGIGSGSGLDCDRMPPVVAEVVGIAELGDAAVDKDAELRGLGGGGPVAQAVPFRIGDGEALPSGAELEQVSSNGITAWMTSCSALSEAVSRTSTRRQMGGCQSSSSTFRRAIRLT